MLMPTPDEQQASSRQCRKPEAWRCARTVVVGIRRVAETKIGAAAARVRRGDRVTGLVADINLIGPKHFKLRLTNQTNVRTIERMVEPYAKPNVSVW